MPTGISLHIGVNEYDPNHFSASANLAGCENDAKALQTIADSLGYESQLLLSQQATLNQVVKQINLAANKLQAGDIFFVSFSGHGSRRTDFNGDEDDGQDETWGIHDQQLIDDQLQFLWHRFKEGVRIVMVSDSCHSGNVSKDADELAVAASDVSPTPRLMPVEYAWYANKVHKAMYKSAQALIDPVAHLKSPIPASLLLLSGCQDNEFSFEITGNGHFTKVLIDIFNNGGSEKSYSDFFEEIKDRIAAEQAHWEKTQTPNLTADGTENTGFLNSHPFAI